jgi:hypothetical protein
MAEISKQALKVQNNTEFPNNNGGLITPTNLRSFNVSMIDSLVDEIGYNVDSGSWNVSISGINTFTASTAVSITNLNASSASQQVSINNLNSFTASASGLSTGSLLVTASAASNVITFTKGNNTTFSVTVADTTDLSSLNTFTASAAISITNLNASSASQQVSINNLNTTTASLLVETQNLELFSASALVSITNLNASSASQQTSINNLNLYTSSFNINTLVSTASFNSYTSSNNQRVSSLETNSASVNVSITNINTFTSSANQRLNSIEAQSGSWITESETASFARTNVDNNFSANQTFTNITATSASIRFLTTLYETASVIYSSGSNQFGDELTDIQTLSGSVRVQGSLTVNGTPVLTSSVDISGLTTTASFNAYTQSNNQRVSSLETNSASVNISITNVNSATASLFTSVNNINSTTASLLVETQNLELFSASALISISNLNQSSASQQISIDNLNQKTGSYATTGSNTFTGTQTINADLYVSGNTDLSFLNIRDLGGINLAATGSGPVTAYGIVTNPSNGDLVFNTNPGNGRLMTFNQTNGVMNPFNGMKLDTSFIGIDVYDHPLNLSSSYGGMTTMLTTKGNIVVSGSMIASGSATIIGNTTITGLSTITGNTTITGSLIVSASSAGAAIATFNSRVLVTGPTTGNTPNLIISASDAVATTRRFAWDINSQNSSNINPSLTMYAHPTASTTISMGVYDPITFADSGEFLVQTTKNGTIMQDFQDGGDFSYNTWLTIPRNDGSNPKPIFNRGLATSGSISVSAGNQINLPTGSNQQAGTAVLNGGNPGTVTVSNSKVTANSIIMLTKQTLTNAHMVAITAKSASSFTITSNGNGDTDTVGWFIINNS